MSQPITAPHRRFEIIGSMRQREPVSAVSLPSELTASIDQWAEGHDLSRSEAIRQLIEIGLTSAG